MKAYTLVIHGGAGNLVPPSRSDKKAVDWFKAREADLHRVLEKTQDILREGGMAVDAVQHAVEMLEDLPGFNAGRGAVLNAEGEAELDASIMCGLTQKAGGVTGIRHICNPIRLAKAVMDHSYHTVLAGAGAEAFADAQNLERVPNSYFQTARQKSSLKQAQKEGQNVDPTGSAGNTVGAVAYDMHGNVAAATSTGGVVNKTPGRVSDSALPGAGTFARNGVCALSCTGHGDVFVRCATAASVAARIEHGGMTLLKAARHGLDEIKSLHGEGGIIAVDARGKPVLEFNSPGMYRGVVTHKTKAQVAIFD